MDCHEITPLRSTSSSPSVSSPVRISCGGRQSSPEAVLFALTVEKSARLIKPSLRMVNSCLISDKSLAVKQFQCHCDRLRDGVYICMCVSVSHRWRKHVHMCKQVLRLMLLLVTCCSNYITLPRCSATR